MKIGFTGTQYGITGGQRERVANLLHDLARGPEPHEFHHGCCVGADDTASDLALQLGYRCHGYPAFPVGHSKRAAIAAGEFAVLHTVDADPLRRNRAIVDACEVLIVAPRSRQEELRSGTWATYRYANSVGRTPVVVWP